MCRAESKGEGRPWPRSQAIQEKGWVSRRSCRRGRHGNKTICQIPSLRASDILYTMPPPENGCGVIWKHFDDYRVQINWFIIVVPAATDSPTAHPPKLIVASFGSSLTAAEYPLVVLAVSGVAGLLFPRLKPAGCCHPIGERTSIIHAPPPSTSALHSFTKEHVCVTLTHQRACMCWSRRPRSDAEVTG